MIKMYNVEVLSKFPVVQHFPFGSLFRWEEDPKALPPAVTPHGASHAPTKSANDTTSSGASTAAPWANSQNGVVGSSGLGGRMMPPPSAPFATQSTRQFAKAGLDAQRMPPPMSAFRAPARPSQAAAEGNGHEASPGVTRAPWAK